MIEIELIVGTMGIDAIVGNKLPRYSGALLQRAASVLKDFKQGAQKFGELRSPDPLEPPKIKYSAYEEITKGLLEDTEMMEITQGLETWPAELQMDVIVQLADVREYLTTQIPKMEVIGTIYTEEVTPSDTDKFRFLWQANLCNDVRVFIDLLLCGAITPLESSLMRTLFPETHDYLMVEILDQMLEAVVKGKGAQWEGGWRKQALSSFFGVPLASFQDVMQNQTGMQEKTAGRPKGPGTIQMAQVSQSDSQRLQTRTLDKSKL